MTSPFSHSQYTAFKHQHSAAFTRFHRYPHPFFFTGISCGCSVSICLVKSSQAIFLPRRPATTTSQIHFPEAKGARVQLCPVTLPCAAEFSGDTAAVSEGSCHFHLTNLALLFLPCCSQLCPEKQSFVTVVAGEKAPRCSAFSWGILEPLARAQRADP